MDRNEARKAAEIMLAYADGKEVEFLDINGRWNAMTNPTFNWGDKDDIYRIKPQPKYRPFNSAEECWQEMLRHQPFGWVKDKTDGHYAHVTRIDNGEGNCTIGVNCGWDLEEISKRYTFPDGEPFGVKEEEA